MRSEKMANPWSGTSFRSAGTATWIPARPVIMRMQQICHGHWSRISWSAISRGNRPLSESKSPVGTGLCAPLKNSKTRRLPVLSCHSKKVPTRRRGASESLRQRGGVLAGASQGTFESFDGEFTIHHSFQIGRADRMTQIADFEVPVKNLAERRQAVRQSLVGVRN